MNPAMPGFLLSNLQGVAHFRALPGYLYNRLARRY
jgi:hypothetical protein